MAAKRGLCPSSRVQGHYSSIARRLGAGRRVRAMRVAAHASNSSDAPPSVGSTTEAAAGAAEESGEFIGAASFVPVESGEFISATPSVPGGAAAAALMLDQVQFPPSPEAYKAAVEAMINLERAAMRFKILFWMMATVGAALIVTPVQLLQVIINHTPSNMELLFVRIVGVTTLFKASLAHMLKGCAERDRLGSMTAQRVMLGMMIRAITNLMQFKTIVANWLAFQNPVVLLAYPILLIYSFMVNLLAFEPYNPYFVWKVVWPIGLGMLLASFIPKKALAFEASQLPSTANTWMKTGVLAAVPAKAAGVLPKLGKVLAKVAPKLAKFLKKELATKTFAAVMPKEAGPTLTKTVVGKMDFLPPQTGTAWGYFAIMMAHFFTMFEAFAPEVLFIGQITPFSQIMKMTWSAGFLAAAFCCDALKTAAERGSLELIGNLQLHIYLAALEIGFGLCLLYGIATGAVALGAGYFRVATSVMCAAFFLIQYRSAHTQAEVAGFPTQPAVATVEFLAEREKKDTNILISAIAATVLTIVSTMV